MSEKVICILGMHRSGTSCLSGSLQNAGLFLGEVSRSGPFNPKGNRENVEIQRLQDDILSSNGGLWHNPPSQVIWSEAHYATLKRILAQYKEVPAWGFKDPRTLFTYDGFKQCIEHLQPVGTFRNPGAVVASLAHRHSKVDPETPVSNDYWLDLWNQYNLRLIEIWKQNPFPVIDFDQPDLEYLRSLETLISQLELNTPFWATLTQKGIKAALNKLMSPRTVFFDPKLRSSSPWSIEEMPATIKATYQSLQEIAL